MVEPALYAKMSSHVHMKPGFSTTVSVCADLERLAAQGELLSQDDTSVRMLPRIGTNRPMRAPAEARGCSRPQERTGMSPTACVVKLGEPTSCLAAAPALPLRHNGAQRLHCQRAHQPACHRSACRGERLGVPGGMASAPCRGLCRALGVGPWSAQARRAPPEATRRQSWAMWARSGCPCHRPMISARADRGPRVSAVLGHHVQRPCAKRFRHREPFIMPAYLQRMVVMRYPFSMSKQLWVDMPQMSHALYHATCRGLPLCCGVGRSDRSCAARGADQCLAPSRPARWWQHWSFQPL